MRSICAARAGGSTAAGVSASATAMIASCASTVANAQTKKEGQPKLPLWFDTEPQDDPARR